MSRKSKPRNNTQRLMRKIHIYSSMFMLLIMLFFTLTGFTLNHRHWFSGKGSFETVDVQIPQTLIDDPDWQRNPLQVAAKLQRWLADSQGIRSASVSYEWDEEEQLLMLELKQPGATRSLELIAGESEALLSHRTKGLVAQWNDLHMGRYTSGWWSLFIDFSALVMVLFTLTGMWLVIPQKKRRTRLFVASGLGLGLTLGFSVLALIPL